MPETVADSSSVSAADRIICVTIAVPTYHRPEMLRRLLPELLDQAADAEGKLSGFSVGVLVIDNDGGKSARAVVEASADTRIRYVVEPTPGISAVRNRAIDESGTSQVLAFIDDDERPGDGWLRNLLRVWSETRAAAVSGRVVAEYDGDLDPWIASGEFFRRRRLPTGTRLDVAAAGNLLLDLDQVRAAAVRFESRFGLSGGEDTLFTRTLANRGLLMVWCDESVVTDLVTVDRMTRRWVLFRAWSHGNSVALIDVQLAAPGAKRLAARARGVGRGAARAVGGAGQYSAGVITRSDRHQARGLRTMFRGVGMASGAAGYVYQEYARPNPERRRGRLSGRRR